MKDYVLWTCSVKKILHLEINKKCIMIFVNSSHAIQKNAGMKQNYRGKEIIHLFLIIERAVRVGCTVRYLGYDVWIS